LGSAVLDSYAVLAFLFKEDGHQKVLELLENSIESDTGIFIASPNWAEIGYIVERKAGAAKWGEVRDRLLGLPIEIIAADRALAELAGELKVSGGMSLADCFAAALAKQKKAVLYTGDPKFKAVEKEVSIEWL
jgi:predicted nucleic acid-binding protein